MEGAGEGMVAIVQALQDAGLSVTLTSGASERQDSRQSPAYSGMSKTLNWNGQVSRATNSQMDGFPCRAHGGGVAMRNGMNSNQLAHSSKSAGSPLNQHIDASPSRLRHHSNENSFVPCPVCQEVVTQTFGDPVCSRSSAHWSQRGVPSSHSSRATDAFAESLRKYPSSLSPERSTSADIIQRLLYYTQSKNLTKSSCHSKSLRSLRNTNEPYRDCHISKGSNKKVQTCTRNASPRETSPHRQGLRLNERRRSLHSPRSEGVRGKDSGLSANYDYLKSVPPRFNPSRGTEVRYLQDVTKYVRDTIRQICDEQPMTCPNIASRYSQHKRECPKKSGHVQLSSESITVEVQTTPEASREACVTRSPPGECYDTCPKIASRYSKHIQECPKKTGQPSSDLVNTKVQTTPVTEDSAVPPPSDCYDKSTSLGSKTCSFCRRPVPCLCRNTGSLRKIRFSPAGPCPRYAVQGIVPKPECPENDPCPCPDPVDEFRKKLEYHILEWLKEIPVSVRFYSSNERNREKIMMDLAEKLMMLREVGDFEDRMRKYVIECLDSLPMWLPTSTRDQEVLKNQLADDLIKNRLLDLFKKKDMFDEAIAKWVDELNFDTNIEPVNKRKVVEDFINRLKPLDQYRTKDNKLYRDDLKDNILEMLEKLPLYTTGNKIEYQNEKINKLADTLVALPKTEHEEKDLIKKVIHDWLKDVDEEKDLKPSQSKKLVEQLSGNVKDLFKKDMDEDDLHNLMGNVIDDWIESTLQFPDDLPRHLQNKILDWLNCVPELTGKSPSTIEDNDVISMKIAKKVESLLPKLLDDDSAENQLLEYIDYELNEALDKRGAHKNPNAVNKMAKDLLSKLIDFLKQSDIGRLENDLRKRVQDWLDSKPEFTSDRSSIIQENEETSKVIAKKVKGLLPELLKDDNVKNQLLDDLNDKLKAILEKRGQHKSQKTINNLADDLLNTVIDTAKESEKRQLDKLEKDLRKLVLQELENTPQLTGDTPSSKRDNDQLAKDFAMKLLQVPTENLDNDAVKDEIIENMMDQLNDTLHKRGQRKDPNGMKKLAENLFDKLKNTVQKAKNGKCKLEQDLKQKILDIIDEIPELNANNPATKHDNDTFSDVLAKKLLDVPPEYIDNDHVKGKLLEDLNDQLTEILEKRGQYRNPIETTKLAGDMLNELIDATKKVNKSKKDSHSTITDPFENEIQMKVIQYFNNVPELSGYTPKNKRDNDKISKEIAKKTKDLLPDLIGDDDTKTQWLEDITQKLSYILDIRDEHKDPETVKKLAEDLLDNLTDTLKDGVKSDLNNLEGTLRNIVLKQLDETPQLIGDTPSSKRDNNQLAKDVANMLLQVPADNLDNDAIKENIKVEITDQLSEALRKRGLHRDSKGMKKLTEILFDKLKNTVQNANKENPLEQDLRHKIVDMLDKVPEFAGDDSVSKRYNDTFSKDLAKKLLDVPSEDIDNEDTRDQLLEHLNDQLNESLEKRGQYKNPKDTKKLAGNMLNKSIDAIKKSSKIKQDLIPITDPLENELRNTVLAYLDDIPELSGNTPSSVRDNDNISKDIAKTIKDLLPTILNDDDLKDQLVEDINKRLKDSLNQRGQQKDPKTIKKLAEDMLNKLLNVAKKKRNNLDILENALKKEILDWLDEIPELAGSSLNIRNEHDQFSGDVAKKVCQLPPSALEDDNMREYLSDEINDLLDNAFQRRNLLYDATITRDLANDLVNRLADAVNKIQFKSGPESVKDLLASDSKSKILDWIGHKPELLATTSSEIKDNESLGKNLAMIISPSGSQSMPTGEMNNIVEKINEQLKEHLKKKGKYIGTKQTENIAKDFVNNFVPKSAKQKRKRTTLKTSSESTILTTSGSDSSQLRNQVWNWFQNIPELSVGDSVENQRSVDKLADNLNKLNDEGASKTQMQDEILKWLDTTSKKKNVRFSQIEKDVLKNKLLDTITQKPKNIYDSTEETKRKVWKWFNKIPEIAIGDSAANKASVDRLANKLASLKDEGGIKKMEDAIDDWLHKTSDKKGVHFNKPQKEMIRSSLINSLKSKTSKPLSSSFEDDETKKYIWDWFKDIPDLSVGDAGENKKLINTLANKMKKYTSDKSSISGQKMKDEIEEWLENTANQKGVVLNKKEKGKLITKLAEAMKSMPFKKIMIKEPLGDDEVLSGPVWDWFKDIPELSGGLTSENKTKAEELNKRLQHLGDRTIDADDAEEIEDAIEDWIDDVAVRKGVKMNSKKRKQLRKKLMDAAFPKLSSKQTIYSDDNNADDFQQIWKWFLDIPEISRGDRNKNEIMVKKLAKKLKIIQDQNLDNEHKRHKMQGVIDNWLQDVAQMKGEKLNSRIKEDLRNKLMTALPFSKKQKHRLTRISSYTDVRFRHGPLIWDWFHKIPEISSGNKIEKTKQVNNLARVIQKIEDEGDDDDDDESSTVKLQETIDSWLRKIAEKKGAKLSNEKIKSLRNDLMNGLKPNQTKRKSKIKPTAFDEEEEETHASFSNETNSETLEDSNSKSMESEDETTDKLNKKPKHPATEKLVEKLKAYKSALKGPKDTDVEQDRKNIARQLQNLPELTFDDENLAESFVDKFYDDLKSLKKDGIVQDENEFKNEINNWLEDIYKKTGRKIDNRTKENLVNEIIEAVKSKLFQKRKKNSSYQPIGGKTRKNKQKLNRSPEDTSQTTYSYNGPEETNSYGSGAKKLKKIMKETDTASPNIKSSLSNHSKARKRWNKEESTRLHSDNSNDSKSPRRSIKSSENTIDTIVSNDEDTTSNISRKLLPKTTELGPSGSRSHGSRLNSKTQIKPIPEKDLRQLIIGTGINSNNVPESSNQSNKKRKLKTKERQNSKGSTSSQSQKKPSSLKKPGNEQSEVPLTSSEASFRHDPRLRARSDVASRKLIEKALKTLPNLDEQKSSSNSNRSTEIFYVEGSDSNGLQMRRKSVATQQPIKKTNKKSGEGEKTPTIQIKMSKPTTDKIVECLAKNIDTIKSPDYADAEEDIFSILNEDLDLPLNEIHALAKLITKRARRENGIDDDRDKEEVDITQYDLNSESDDETSGDSPRTMNQARRLVRGVLDETFDFNSDSQRQMEVEDALVDLIAVQLEQGDIDDLTKDAILKLLKKAQVPEHIANEICEKLLRRARQRPMSFSEYQPSISSRNRIAALTPSQKVAFLENAQREIADFYDELTGTLSPSTKQVVSEAIKDTVAKLAEILDEPELTGEQKKNMMRNEIIRYLRKLPTLSNVSEEELADQLMDRVQNLKFTSSTPENSQIEDYRRTIGNPEPSFSTIYDNELESNESLFKEQLANAIQSWSENIDAIKDKVGFKGTMAKDLVNEMVDRQKYLQVNPDAKSTDEEEQEHSKYIVFKWLNKMVDLNDLTDAASNIDDLVDAVNAIPVPKMAEPSNRQGSLWALSRTSRGDFTHLDPFEMDVFEWLHHVSPDLYVNNDPDVQERQVKQFINGVQKHKGKPNTEEFVEKEINQWLPTMIKPTDKSVIDKTRDQLKSIMKQNGFVNTLQTIPEMQAGTSKEPVISLQPPGNTEMQPNPSSVSPQAQHSIPPQDREYILVNKQNQQVIPNDSVSSKVTDWVSTLPLHVKNSEEQKLFDKKKQNLIWQLKQIRHEYPPTSNEYKSMQREAIRLFLQDIPSDPEKILDDIFLTEKTDELLHDLGVIPSEMTRGDIPSPKFKKATDVLYDVVDNWVKDLPIYSEKPDEDPEKINAMKQNITSKLIFRLGELNMNSEILNDDFLYEDLLLDEVDRLLKDVPRNPELDKYLPALKMELAAKVKDARQKIRDELAGKAYKQQLRDTISQSLCLPDNLSPDEQASFEILKDNLADAFINLHYVPDNQEDMKKFKTKLYDEINRFCNEFLRRHPRLPIDRRKLTQDLYNALLGVPVPRDELMRHEVEQARIKDLINDWMKELPFKDETLIEQSQRNKMASLLAKRLHELEKESNPEWESEMFGEISKWLRKQQLRPGQEVYIPEFADRLKNKLKRTEYSRRFDSSDRPLYQVESGPSMVCIGRLPACALSREDRSHLQRIREIQKSPCSRDAILCPPVDSYIQRRPRSPCSKDTIVGNPCTRDSMVCPRMNSYSQTEVRPKYSDQSSWCRKEFCPSKTQNAASISGTYCSIRKKQDASCMTPTQSPYEILSPNVIVKEYHWDTTNGSKQQDGSQQTQLQQQPQTSHSSRYQTPQQSHQVPPPGYQTPRQSFPQQSSNYIPTAHQHSTPQPSTSSAYRPPNCECCPHPDEGIPCNPKLKRCIRTPDDTSGEESYLEPGTSRFRRVRVTRLGSLDDMHCQRRPSQNKFRSGICDEASQWFPENQAFWDCPRHFCEVPGPIFHEREQKQKREKGKCKCKERSGSSFRGRNGRRFRDYDTRHCNIHCPHPSYMYFR